jgi:hypothetical protein
MHAELNGVLRPKTCKPFTAIPEYGRAEWGNAFWGESEENAVVEHQQDQAGFPTSGLSTTPHISRAIFYATHDGKYQRAYIYIINSARCKDFGVSEFIVNEIVPFPSVAEDDEVILVAHDGGNLPSLLIEEIQEIFIEQHD